MADISDLDEVNRRVRESVTAQYNEQLRFSELIKAGKAPFPFFFDDVQICSWLYQEELPMTPVEKLIAERKQNAS